MELTIKDLELIILIATIIVAAIGLIYYTFNRIVSPGYEPFDDEEV